MTSLQSPSFKSGSLLGSSAEQRQMWRFLREVRLFGGLDDKELIRIGTRAKLRQFFPNDTIVWQGQPSNSLFLITNGIVGVKNISGEKEKILAYLMPGNTFGEVGILENQPRSASVVALSDVDVMVIQREDFLSILHRHSSVAIELSRILGKYLIDANRRLSKIDQKTQVILIFNPDHTSLGAGMAGVIAGRMSQLSQRPTAYVEFAYSQEVTEQLKSFGSTGSTLRHPAGYDLMLPQEDTHLPSATQAALMMDKLRNNYDNIVINLGHEVDDAVSMMLEYAKQVLIMGLPTEESQHKMGHLQQAIKRRIRPGETSIFTLVRQEEEGAIPRDFVPPPDFKLPYLPDFPTFHLPKRQELHVPKEIEVVVDTCLDRLERTHNVSVFIPTTIEVDQQFDSQAYVQRTLEFLAERFGGATSREGSGVWNSEDAGLVGEKVFIVESYMNQSDLNEHLNQVVDFVKQIKVELRQEAMALEVDRKLTLI
ncbi:MAG: cyclic nucleotide-binding domain-containing protein [Bacteroidota bacterium]